MIYFWQHQQKGKFINLCIVADPSGGTWVHFGPREGAEAAPLFLYGLSNPICQDSTLEAVAGLLPFATLHDWQRLLVDVQWIRSFLSIPMGGFTTPL